MIKYVFVDNKYSNVKYTINAETCIEAENKLMFQTGQHIGDFTLLEVIYK